MAPKIPKRPHPHSEAPRVPQTGHEDPPARNIRPRTHADAEHKTQPTPRARHRTQQSRQAARPDTTPSAASPASSDDEAPGSATSPDRRDSEAASSAEEDDTADDERTTIAPHPASALRRPEITGDPRGVAGAVLRQRLDAFLPQLRDANRRLERLPGGGELSRIDAGGADGDGMGATFVDGEGGDSEGDGAADAGPYVEMDLGLGVLEEQGCDGGGGGGGGEEQDDAGGGGGPAKPPGHGGVLGELMGQGAPKRAPVIEEI